MENKVDLVETIYKDIENLSKNTHDRYKRDSGRFRDYAADRGDFREVCGSKDIVNTVIAYKNKLRANGLRTSSIISNISSLKHFFSVLRERNFIEEDRLKNAKSLRLRVDPAESRSAELVLTDGKFEVLRGYLRKRGNLLSRLIVSLLSSSGARAHELSAILVGNINLEAAEIYLAKTKGGRPRLVKVNAETVSFLREFIEKRKLTSGDYLLPFQSESWFFRQVQKLAKTTRQKFSSHSFRWRYANRLGKVMKREYLAALMGHGRSLGVLYRSKDESAFWNEISNAYDSARIALI